MASNQTSLGDRQFDLTLAHVLRAGVLLSATIVSFGGVLLLVRHGFERPAYHAFRGEPPLFRSVRGIMETATSLSGRGLVQLGLLILIGTPIARVVFSMIGFARERDWMYVGITAVVLALLAFSLLASS